MDNQTISAVPTTDSEVFADCESFLTDLSANDESMIAGGIYLHRSYAKFRFKEYYRYRRRRYHYRYYYRHSKSNRRRGRTIY